MDGKEKMILIRSAMCFVSTKMDGCTARNQKKKAITFFACLCKRVKESCLKNGGNPWVVYGDSRLGGVPPETNTSKI